MKILIATHNQDKLKEIKFIFNLPFLEIIDLNDFPDLPEVIEDGLTFEANAIKKAVTSAMCTGLWSMADDSGLEVDALNGAPGILSARYAGEPVDYKSNNNKLIKNMKDISSNKARFICVIAIADTLGHFKTVKGVCEGHIIKTPRGCNGFGYDPLFIPCGYNKTFAEMESEFKNKISHRTKALNIAKREWFSLLSDSNII